MINRELLTANGQAVTTFVDGFSQVGIGILGTWVGTVTIYGSVDGITYFLQSVTPYPSGTDVSSMTANANYFTQVKNLRFIKIVFTRTSGSVQITVAASQDASWQAAFFTPAQTTNSSLATSGTNTLTESAQANLALNLTSLSLSVAGPPPAGGTPRVTVYDGTIAGTVLWEEYVPTPSIAGSVGTTYVFSLPRGADGIQSVIGTPGNAMTIVAFGFPGQSTRLNARFTPG